MNPKGRPAQRDPLETSAVLISPARTSRSAYVDTDLTRGLDAPKSTPQEFVRRALDGLESGQDEVLADELTRQVKDGMTAPRPSYLPQPG
jgi:hypothetical protein